MNDAEPLPAPTGKPRARLPKRAILIAILGLLAAGIVYPPTFQAAIRYFLTFEAARKNVKLTLGKVDGSVFEPVRIENIAVSFSPPTGVDADIEIDSAEASFSFKNIFVSSGHRFLDHLKLTNVDCTLRLIQEGDEEELGEPEEKRVYKGETLLRYFAPTTIEARGANLTIRQGPESFQLRNVAFTTSMIAPGTIWFEEIAIYRDWIRKRFRGVSGTTTQHGTTFTINNLVLDKGVEFNTLSADLGEIANGAVRLEFVLNAFSGVTKGEVTTQPHRRRLTIEANGSFSQISIPQVADFLAYPDAAGGIIKDGKFTFSGSPRNLTHATLWTRLEADDFRWGKRQWNSLRLGATLVNRRLQIPDLRLRQGDNTINLAGELSLPSGTEPWWKSDFRFDLQADIKDLNDLSNLLGPEFSNVYGRIAVDGSIRSSHDKLGGQLIATGSHISWRGAPLDSLQAALKISEDELQIANLEFSHGYDYLRAKGVVNILGERQYSGEVKASVDDLALYDAILQPPIVPQAPAGGLNIEWSGDGTSKAHSGAFKATFRKVRPLVATATKIPPLDASLEGSYSPGNVFLSRCDVADGSTAFSSQVVVSPASLEFKDLTFRQGKKTVLEGNAKLPVDIWTTWPEPKADVQAPAKVQLTAKDLQLNELLHLWGQKLPVALRIDMTANGDGPLADLQLSGTVSGNDAELYQTPAGSIRGDLALTISGTCGSAQVGGTIRPDQVEFSPKLTLNDLMTGTDMDFPPLPALGAEPFANWKLDVECSTQKPLKLGETSARVGTQMHLIGTAAKPSLVGELTVNDLPVSAEHVTNLKTRGTIRISDAGDKTNAEPSGKIEPSLDLISQGNAEAYAVSIYVSGPIQKPAAKLVTTPELSEQDARKLIVEGVAPTPTPSPTPSPAPSPSPEATVPPQEPVTTGTSEPASSGTIRGTNTPSGADSAPAGTPTAQP